MPSITTPCAVRSGASLIASGTPDAQKAFLDSLTDRELMALPTLFPFWALPHQMPPEGDWRTWVILGGRGAGKTRAGAEWVRSRCEGATPRRKGPSRRVAIIGETYDQARDVMVFGESGILACSPQDQRPTWIAGRRLLRWTNGAEAQIFSAFDPEALRGPQFDAVWADELAKWKNGQATWEMVEFGLRLGADPRAVITTTPRNAEALRDLLAQPSCVRTHAPTRANAANLADSFLVEIERRFGGTRLGRQELEGVMLQDAEGALWSSVRLQEMIVEKVETPDRIVVAVDPPTTGHRGSDACGIVVAGVVMEGGPSDWQAVVLEDATVQAASPLDWATAAVKAYRRHGADRIVAEVNQGGDMVEAIVRQVDALVPYKGVNARKGKAARAEPVAALYEQGRVRHLRGLGALEDQMCLMTAQGFEGTGSPDRVDALVWALHELMIAPAQSYRSPRMRRL